MGSRTLVILGVVFVLVVMGLIALTLALTPENTHPAYDAAVRFMNAAGEGDEETALALLGADLQAYVAANCDSVTACIDDYTPPEWGDLIAAVYRRSRPDGLAWDVQLVATYEEGQGFAGVCIYHRMEEVADDEWRVMAWSGFVSCDDPDSGLSDLRRTDAVNRAP